MTDDSNPNGPVTALMVIVGLSGLGLTIGMLQHDLLVTFAVLATETAICTAIYLTTSKEGDWTYVFTRKRVRWVVFATTLIVVEVGNMMVLPWLYRLLAPAFNILIFMLFVVKEVVGGSVTSARSAATTAESVKTDKKS